MGEEVTDTERATIPRTKERLLKDLPETNHPDCYMTIRSSPNMTMGKDRHEDGLEAFNVSKSKNSLWVFLHDVVRGVSGWGGVVSVTYDPPQHLTTMGYYPVIRNPITEYKTVKECLSLLKRQHMRWDKSIQSQHLT